MSEKVSVLNQKEESKMTTIQPGELREFEKLDLLLSQIPKKAQHGLLMSCDLVLTCIDANCLYIALGTNVGVVFLYSRSDHSMQRLKCVSTNDVITSVRLHHGIDDQLAFATASGDLSIYFIPGKASVHRKQLQKFEVKEIHKHYVTCLEWSTNGIKLFSGDKNGLVVTTEVDFFEGQCRSSLLLVEAATEIIQLDYKHRILLISTRQRSFIVRIDQKCQVLTVGTKDRKIPGSFGACFIPDMCKTDDARLYAARPGCRLWLADVNGVVINTYIFTDPLSVAVPEIPLLSAGKLQVGQPDFQFGKLKSFRGKEIVTWSNTALVVLDPEASRVVARQGRLNGIVDVAVVDDSEEIFLLRRHAEARVIRIAATSEPKLAKAEILPAVMAEKSALKDDKDKENPAQSFLKKLTKPLKHLDKSILHDNKQHPVLHEQTRSSTVISPVLPPVVKLASPELEGVRVFTGGSLASEDTSTGVAVGIGIDSLPGVSALTSTSSPVATTASPTTNIPSSPVSSFPVPKITTDATSHELPPLAEGPQDKGESIPPAKNSEEDNIVFSHKMRKHKKKKSKEGLLAPKYKDEDSVSLVSVSSQLSDDATVTSAGSSTPSTSDTALNTLQLADDMLTLVDSLLNKDSGAVLSSSGAAYSVHDRKGSQVSDFSALPQAEYLVTTEEKPKTLMATSEKKSETIVIPNEEKLATSVYNGNSSATKREIGPGVSEKYVVLTNRDNSHTVKDGLNNVGVPIYDSSEMSKNFTASLLSECDQHLEMSKELKTVPTDVSDQQKLAQDASKIVESAMVNLAKSEVTTTKVQTQDSDYSRPNLQSGPAKSGITGQISFQDIYSEIEVIESTDPFRKGYKRDNSADDFYSLFLDTSPESPVSPVGKNPMADVRPTIPLMSEAEHSTEMEDVAERRLANTWSDFTTPANIYSLVLSNSHIWFTDKSENIYYSSVGNAKGIQWRKASGHANQISVSPSGQIVWRLHRGVVYAGTKISSRHPEGLKWVEAVRDVATISVDNDCAWFVMHNGDVMMQRRLSVDRPCYKSQKVECPHRLKHIHVRHGIVWAITEQLGLLVRTGVSDELPEGTGWELDNREVPPYLFSHVALDNENIGWAIDVLGHIWFCDGVTREQPLGRRRWWQVPLSEYILHDETTLDMIRGLARKFDPMKLSDILRTNRGGLITAGSQGIWLAMDFRNVLQVCRGNVQGYHWLEAQPAKMSPSSTWKQVCAEVSHLDWGLVWAQHTNGDVFTFKRAQVEASVIPDCSDFYCIAVGPTAAWALTSSGDIYVRAGMGPHCPQGTGWVSLDISQLGGAHIVHISCNSLYVWAAEAEGTVYQRIGAKPPSENNLSPVWLPIDTFDAIVFTRVCTGPLDWMVWAIDNRKLIYIRAGITENMPIGQEWVHVPGIQAMDLALTKTGVWALTPSGEIYFRYGIARDRPCGNYWKKIPGSFMKISASANDELWGISRDGQLMQCSVKYLIRHQDSVDPLLQPGISTSNSVSEDMDWEIV